MAKDRLVSPSYCLILAANFLLYFGFYLLMPVFPFYLTEFFQTSSSMMGFALSCYTIAALLIRPFSGYLLDTLARKPLYLVAYFIFMSIFAGYMVAGTLTVFIILRIAHGLAFGTVTVSGNTLVIDITPSSRRGEALGYYGLANNIAMSVGPMVGLFMHDAGLSFNVLFTGALCSCVLGLICASLVKAPVKPTVPKKEPISLDRFLLLKGIPGAITTIFLSFAYGVLSTYVAVYGTEEIGLTGGTGMFFVCLSGGLVVSRLISGQLINRGYLTQVSKMGISLLIASFLCFVLFKIPAVFYACGVAIGVGYGLLCPTLQTMFINLAQHNQRGTANATYLTSWDFGVGAGVLLGGVIAQHTSYSWAFTLGTILLCIGLALFFLWAGPYFDRNKLR